MNRLTPYLFCFMTLVTSVPADPILEWTTLESYLDDSFISRQNDLILARTNAELKYARREESINFEINELTASVPRFNQSRSIQSTFGFTLSAPTPIDGEVGIALSAITFFDDIRTGLTSHRSLTLDATITQPLIGSAAIPFSGRRRAELRQELEVATSNIDRKDQVDRWIQLYAQLCRIEAKRTYLLAERNALEKLLEYTRSRMESGNSSLDSVWVIEEERVGIDVDLNLNRLTFSEILAAITVEIPQIELLEYDGCTIPEVTVSFLSQIESDAETVPENRRAHLLGNLLEIDLHDLLIDRRPRIVFSAGITTSVLDEYRWDISLASLLRREDNPVPYLSVTLQFPGPLFRSERDSVVQQYHYSILEVEEEMHRRLIESESVIRSLAPLGEIIQKREEQFRLASVRWNRMQESLQKGFSELPDLIAEERTRAEHRYYLSIARIDFWEAVARSEAMGVH